MAVRSPWRARVAAVNGLDDGPPALGRIEALVGLGRRGLGGELLVLDDPAEPAGVVGAAPVVLPRLLVHALGDLREEHEVLRAQVEAVAGPAEIEAEVLGELALGVLAHVAVLRLLRPQRLHRDRRLAGAAFPEEDLLL